MICERIREQIPDCLAGRLDAKARENVIDHLDACSACRNEMAELGVVWRGLESMSEPEPGPAVKTRFLEMLNAYQEGYQEAQRRHVFAAPKSWWAGLWPAHPAWQAAFAAALLILGGLGGRYALAPRAATSDSDMAQLKGEVQSLRQLVTLSMLQQESPSARLRGVTYSYQMAQPDRQVEQALLHAVNHDANVNVRLSAVDALAKFGNNPDVRRALSDSLAIQDSPLVQIALVDLLVQFNDPGAAAGLRRLAQDQQADIAARQRAAAAAQKLEVVR